jgi:hypothetical protein
VAGTFFAGVALAARGLAGVLAAGFAGAVDFLAELVAFAAGMSDSSD